MTPGDNPSGSDDEQPPREPAFNWELTPSEPEPEPERDRTEPPATEALTAADLPTGLMDVADMPTAAINAADLPTAAMQMPTRRELRMPAAVDPALEGATEVLGAHPVSSAGPEGESVDHDAVTALFGEDRFVEYEEQPGSALVPAALIRSRAPQAPRPPIPRGQLIAISIAAGLVAALALAALFLAGTRIGDSLPAVAVSTPIPTDSSTAVPTVGPLPAGTHGWNTLLGGECLEPFESAWQDEYTVIDCAEPHAGQLLVRGEFDDVVSAPYPEIDELVARTTALCSTDAVINFAAAQAFTDLQLVTSFAPTAKDWESGQRTYFCYATRSGDDALTESVAQPPAAAEAAATAE
ncbi:putative regulator of septum formation [Rhodoglobus vestalii]|uniref:Putative regulator of septum formation n=1 Tax=Rhodoglobus vestalii TaxID=193384 RepID=A0A8H2K5F1_9MICO|nr:septum formation family protein [Rhodoglobus vestalii]TQO20158.1 putative regulator of septum formation [Rhodoglobus vestalii]